MLHHQDSARKALEHETQEYWTRVRTLQLTAAQTEELWKCMTDPTYLDEMDIDRFVDLHGFFATDS
jgi:hypothetical protein